MSWARYDDELPMNRKVGELLSVGAPGCAALGLHVLANTWSRHNGTAGAIPAHQAGLLVGDAKLGRKLAGLLVSVGMFDVLDCGWMIHDFHDYSDPNDDGRSAADRKADISAKRTVAGRKGGLAKAGKAGSKEEALLEQTSGPEPVPAPRVPVRENSTPENTPAAGDNSSRHTRIAECYGVMALRVARLKGIPVKLDDAYAGKAQRRIERDPELARIADLFPTAPDDVIAAALHGEKHSLNNYPRADEIDEPLATVHHLPGQEHAS